MSHVRDRTLHLVSVLDERLEPSRGIRCPPAASLSGGPSKAAVEYWLRCGGKISAAARSGSAGVVFRRDWLARTALGLHRNEVNGSWYVGQTGAGIANAGA